MNLLRMAEYIFSLRIQLCGMYIDINKFKYEIAHGKAFLKDAKAIRLKYPS
jgi:hypothetical protein